MFKRSAIIGLLVLLIASFVVPVAAQDDGSNTFTVRVSNTSAPLPLSDVGVFNTPADASEAGPALPGSSYSFNFHADAGHTLSFATMFVQSNDLFFAPAPAGIALFDADGNALSGDVTDQVFLWDAGTEVNEEPGVGENQAPRQMGADTGIEEFGVVSDVMDGFSYPTVAEYIRVTLEAHDSMMTDDAGRQGYTLIIENISGDSSVPGPLAPGVFAAHSADFSLFTVGAAASPGLEAIAEDGAPDTAYHHLHGYRFATPISPVVYVLHSTDVDPFLVGDAVSAGLEAVAEDGDPSLLVEEFTNAGLVAGVAATPDMMSEAGPAFPGSYYEFEVTATPGTVISLFTMFVQSNDWFVAVDSLPLFAEDGTPVAGDFSDHAALYDAGTEVNEALGEGANQPPRQAAPNTGLDEMGVIGLVMSADDMGDDMNADPVMTDDMGDDMSSDDMGDDSMDDMGDDMSSDDMGDDSMDDMSDMDDMDSMDDMMMSGGVPVGVVTVTIYADSMMDME